MKLIDCEHWSDCNLLGGGCCAISKYGDHPSVQTCIHTCRLNGKEGLPVFNGGMISMPKAPPKRSIGLGDTVKWMIDKVTFGKTKPCGGCKKRQERLNKLLPYKGDKNGR